MNTLPRAIWLVARVVAAIIFVTNPAGGSRSDAGALRPALVLVPLHLGARW